MKTAFIGHRKIFAKDIEEKLANAIQTEIRNGCTSFIMGTHGEFDKLALSACRTIRKNCPDIEIEVAITSLNAVKKDIGFDTIPYTDVKTVMFDIEDAHYKQRITLSNQQMIDDCDTLICYVNTSEYRSGANTALRYAEKHGLKIVNLYRKDDQPFYSMTNEQIDEYWRNLLEKH